MIETVLGELSLVGEGSTLTGVYFAGHRPAPDRTGFGPPVRGAFAEAERQLHEYLEGSRRHVDCEVALTGSGRLRRAVWAEIAAIPYGETRTYGELAVLTGSHPRAVGGAVAHNPLSIIVPCHRVLGATGALTGYAGGLERKRALLALEAGTSGRRARHPGDYRESRVHFAPLTAS